MDLLAFLRLLSGTELLALLRRVWGWARLAQHPTVSGHAGSAPSSASGSLYVSAEKVFAASSSTAAYKNFTGAASSPTADAKNADAKNVDAKNRDATSSSLSDDANTKNRGKIADAASSSLADPKNRGKVADATNHKNRGMIADASSSLAANLRPNFRAFTAARATARDSRSGSTTAVLFNVRCRRCGWESRASMEVLFTHASECRHRRYNMEQQLREARAAKKAGARAAAALSKRRW